MTSEGRSDRLVCADCGRSIPWRSDEAGEWPTVEDGETFVTLCFDCYGRRYGKDELEQARGAVHDVQEDERGEDDDRSTDPPMGTEQP